MNATKLVVTSVTKDSPGAGQFTVVGTYTTAQTFSQPPQLQTIFAPPSADATFLRAVRVTPDAVFLLRNGATNVALDMASFAKIAFGIESSLTHAPEIDTQPANDSCVASSTAADFTVVAASSESTLSYQWQYESKSSATLTSDGTNVSNDDTITIGNKTYTFKTTLTPTEGEVLIGASAAESLDNLKLAVNRTNPGPNDGVKYKAAAAHTQVVATTNTDTTQAFLAIAAGTAGNAYPSTEASSHLSFGGGTMSGGGNWTNCSGTVHECAYTNPTTATLTATPTGTGMSGALHRCVVTNANSSVNSDSAILTIT